SQGVHLFWWTPCASEHSTAKGAGKFALTVKVPDRAIIDALRSGHAPIRNHVIKSIDPTPTQRIASS
ncbi:hypothetical protein NKJ70_32205, partial [Mesorhizobium sp. M0092]|uniref:hypothetical protein n=1 Tax=Mesorhizobium sp. M0092 TaxID=2956876 RepID=UPI00333C27CE